MGSIIQKANCRLRLFGFLKVPMIAYVRPRVVDITADRIEVVIRLRRRTKNHLGSMYFGALSVGADVAGGLLAMARIEESGEPVSLVFKDFKADFLRRPTGDVHFICEAGRGIAALVVEAVRTGERVEMSVPIRAIVPTESDEPVAGFVLTLSLKKR